MSPRYRGEIVNKMCGIAGIVSAERVSEKRLQKMIFRMKHRGPDGQGIWQSGDFKVALGHVRLAIVDNTDAGRQPMHHPSGLHCVVNGEFYNYPDLRAQIEEETKFRSKCDSEIVLHGYSKFGIDYIKSLNGMFSFALFDQTKRTLILARDRLGIKPLYYTFYKGDLIFASEIKSIFAAIEINSWNIDKQGLSEFLTYQTTVNERTLFADVKQVRPGHYITLNVDAPGVLEETAFWNADIRPNQDINFDSAVTLFEEVFDASVKRHLLSDVDVSSYLSSGLDSSSVFSRAAFGDGKKPKERFTGYTAKFHQTSQWYDETGPAIELAKRLGVAHQTVNIVAEDVIKNFDQIIDSLDEPRMGMGAFSQFMVAKNVAKKYKVVLTGHGGDELFSGYPVFSFGNRGIFGVKRLSELPHFVYFSLAKIMSIWQQERSYFLPVLWSRRKQAKIFSYMLFDQKPWKEIEVNRNNAKNNYEKIFLDYLLTYLPGLLMVEDKVSMAHSLESRTPLLDNEMIELSLSLPNHIKLKGGILKAVIRQHAKSNLPDTYFKQPKRGFPTPFRHWLRGELNQFMRDRLTGKKSYLGTVFNTHEITEFVENYENSWKRHIRPFDEIQSHQMWQLLSLESWLRTWSEKYGVSLKLQ